MTTHGPSQAKKRGNETRSSPRAIHRLSARAALDMLYLRLMVGNLGRSDRTTALITRLSHLSHPCLIRLVIDLGFRSDASQQPECVCRMRFLRNRIVLVRQVAKPNCSRRTGLHARRNVIGSIDLAPPRRSGFFFRCMESRVTEIAFLHHAAHSRSHSGV